MSFTNPQSPGVYVQIRNAGETVIQGVSTSTLAVFGRTEKGYTDKPYLITSFEQFLREFGGYVSGISDDMFRQVMMFFQNGGGRLYVYRMINGASKSEVIVKDSNDVNNAWKINCVNEGSWGNYISVDIMEIDSSIYRIIVKYNDQVVEDYDNVIFNDMSSQNYVLTVINESSAYINFELLLANPVNPKEGTYNLVGGLDGSAIPLSKYVEIFSTNKIFDKIDEILQFIVVDSSLSSSEYATLINNMISYAESRDDIFIICHIPSGMTVQDAVGYVNNITKSKYCAIYYPQIKFYDMNINRTINIYPDGAIAGIYARVDSDKSVGKSPGGVVDGKINGALGVSVDLTRGDLDVLYPKSINPIINWIQTGLAIWGVRTYSPLTEWRYINAVRTFMFVKKSLYNATHWIVFENNNPTLWFKIKNQLESALLLWFRDGLFAGTKPSDAFYVICDETNNTPESINAGIVNIDVGLAMNKPAEFVRFRLQQKLNK